MATFRLASDLHLEFEGDYKYPRSYKDWYHTYILPTMPNENEQILILAGDILMSKRLNKFAPFFDDISKRFKHIVVIAGNHEHYSSDIEKSYENLKEFYNSYKNVSFLQDETIVLDNIAIFGATLWTNFRNSDPFFMGYAQTSMNDFRHISYKGNILKPEDTVIFHQNTRDKITEFFQNYKNHKKIVVTHHGVTALGANTNFVGSNLNPAFYSSDMDEFIQDADVWVTGHDHCYCDLKLGNTRLVRNTRGYVNYNEDAGYDPTYAFEL